MGIIKKIKRKWNNLSQWQRGDYIWQAKVWGGVLVLVFYIITVWVSLV